MGNSNNSGSSSSSSSKNNNSSSNSSSNNIKISSNNINHTRSNITTTTTTTATSNLAINFLNGINEFNNHNCPICEKRNQSTTKYFSSAIKLKSHYMREHQYKELIEIEPTIRRQGLKLCLDCEGIYINNYSNQGAGGHTSSTKHKNAIKAKKKQQLLNNEES